jgi:hypothetical protein
MMVVVTVSMGMGTRPGGALRTRALHLLSSHDPGFVSAFFVALMGNAIMGVHGGDEGCCHDTPPFVTARRAGRCRRCLTHWPPGVECTAALTMVIVKWHT